MTCVFFDLVKRVLLNVRQSVGGNHLLTIDKNALHRLVARIITFRKITISTNCEVYSTLK